MIGIQEDHLARSYCVVDACDVPNNVLAWESAVMKKGLSVLKGSVLNA